MKASTALASHFVCQFGPVL